MPRDYFAGTSPAKASRQGYCPGFYESQMRKPGLRKLMKISGNPSRKDTESARQNWRVFLMFSGKAPFFRNAYKN